MEKTINTLKEGAVLTAGAIVGAKWLDRNVFFKNKIASDPNFVNGMVYQHWGGIVALASAWGSTRVNNPWLKIGLVGLSVYGLLTEARQDFGVDSSVTPPQPRWGMMGVGQDESAAKLDAALKEAANVSGNLPMAESIPNRYHSFVGLGGGSIPGRYYSFVGGNIGQGPRIPMAW